MMPAPLWMAQLDLGGYVNVFKVLPVLVLLLVWGRLLTWMDKDAEAAHLPRELLNMLVFGGGIVGLVAFILLPNFWIALTGLVLMQVIPVSVYLGLRHSRVGLGDLKNELADFAKGMVKTDKKVKIAAGQVTITSKSGQMLLPPESSDPEAPGYETVQLLLTDPLAKGAERVELRPSGGVCIMQYVVDGVAYNAATLEPAQASAGIAYLKKAAGLDVEDRRRPQSGAIRCALGGVRHELEISTAGTTAGESLRITIDPRNRYAHRIDTLGLLPEQLSILREAAGDLSGLILICAPRGQGLTTMLYSILRMHDAFVNHIQTIEHNPTEDLEGITQNALPVNVSAADEFKQVEWVCSQQPDVLMVDELVNPNSAQEIVRFVGEGRRAYVGMRAANTFDALALWRRLVGDDGLATSHLRLILAGRVIRRLCMACKVAYAPDPETLRKLNMDPAKVSTLYQARTEPLRDNRGNPVPCEFCQELRYKGRFGVYELFVVDDEVRQIVSAGGSVNQLKTAFRKQRGRYLQEVALAQVEAGETSVQEVLRVLRNVEQVMPAPAAIPAGRQSGPRRRAQQPPKA